MNFKSSFVLVLFLQYMALDSVYGTACNRLVQKIRKLISGPCVPCKPMKNSRLCDCRDVIPMQDCKAFLQAGYSKNGLYRLSSPHFNQLSVRCDQKTQGGGWTVLLRRVDGFVDFARNWHDYKLGFGRLEGEFWVGNENMHDLTKPEMAPRKSQLLIDMKIKGKPRVSVHALYDTFAVGSEGTKYQLTLTGATGNVTNPNIFTHHNGMKFSTYDSDNDRHSKQCSHLHGKVGWWYNFCYLTLLTGQYKFTKKDGEITWDWNKKIQPTFVEMKVRRI
uniref:Fibrinogen C-terminal domain-containing protein n=1 Tax=Clytia hemisphaerica TaxID=252671 RepID=A0A7M5TXB7_9CNID